MSSVFSPLECVKGITDFKTTPLSGEDTMDRQRRSIPHSRAFTRRREPEGREGHVATRPPPRRTASSTDPLRSGFHPEQSRLHIPMRPDNKTKTEAPPTCTHDTHLMCGNDATAAQEPSPPRKSDQGAQRPPQARPCKQRNTPRQSTAGAATQRGASTNKFKHF
jgi:hypothetical protein